MSGNRHPFESSRRPALSRGLQSSSSSSSEANDIWPEYLTYSCNCMGMESITNPLAGKAAGMTYRGFFTEVGDINHPGTPHVPRGGLERDAASRGMMSCDDAGRLFSMSSGGVRIMMILPRDINLGVYSPLTGASGAEIEDYVIWGVNMGDEYISQPGIYTAFTPHGIEFTMWSSKGMETVTDRTITCNSGEEITLDFMWDSRGMAKDRMTMAIYLNGAFASGGWGKLGDDSLSNLYDISNGEYVIPRHAGFSVLDSPMGNHGLNCVITGLNVYSTPSLRDVSPPDLALSSSSSSSSSSSGVARAPRNVIGYTAKVTLPFTFMGGTGPDVRITKIETATVERSNISLNSHGASGAARDSGGIDVGKNGQGDNPLPSVPLDMPPGIIEVLDLST